jgi:hypothetical protein
VDERAVMRWPPAGRVGRRLRRMLMPDERWRTSTFSTSWRGRKRALPEPPPPGVPGASSESEQGQGRDPHQDGVVVGRGITFGQIRQICYPADRAGASRRADEPAIWAPVRIAVDDVGTV